MSIRLRQICSLVSALALVSILAIPASAQQGPPMIEKGAIGKITAVSSDSITVMTRNGSDATFTVSSATMVTLDGKASAIADVVKDDFAAVTSTDGKAAAAIDAHDMASTPPLPPGKGAFGEITAIGADSITVMQRDGSTVTFTISSATTIMLDRKTSAVSDLKTGMFAVIASTDGKAATAIYASTRHVFGPPPPPSVGKGALGKVTAVSDDSITVMTPSGSSATFSITSATKVMVNNEPSEVSDIMTDQFAAVASTDGKTATTIYVRTMPPGHGGPGR